MFTVYILVLRGITASVFTLVDLRNGICYQGLGVPAINS